MNRQTNIGKEIEERLIEDIRSALSEFDFDDMVKKLVEKKAVNELVKRLVLEKMSELIQERAFMQIRKHMPIIDAWTNDKVQGFLYGLGVK